MVAPAPPAPPAPPVRSIRAALLARVPTRARTPFATLALMGVAMQLSFASYWTLSKNFAVDALSLSGFQVGVVESVREVPGFLAFLAVFVILLMRERTLALASLVLLGVGTAATGFLPSYAGFLLTTFVMSVGFHYYETMNQSLALQWLPKADAPALLGKLLAVNAAAQLAAYALIWLGWAWLDLSFAATFAVAGLSTLALVALIAALPHPPEGVLQRRELVLRRRYWLYYALTFMSGARRQIFTVFAGLLMVQRFGYEVHHVALLFALNCAFNMVFAPRIGALIGRIGERRALGIEYVGLALVFTAYALVTNPWVAGALFVLDHAFFALAIAQKTYFQKIADASDIAPTAGVAFTINHIAAVGIPVAFGLVWLASPCLVFMAGAGMALVSLALSQLVPDLPEEGTEVRDWRSGPMGAWVPRGRGRSPGWLPFRRMGASPLRGEGVRELPGRRYSPPVILGPRPEDPATNACGAEGDAA